MVDFVFFHPKSAADLNGIFAYLRQQNDPIPESIVTPSSSSINNGEGPQYLLEPSDTFATTNNISNSWFSFDFVDKKVFFTEYTLRTLASSLTDYRSNFPRCWVIEGSNNNKTWLIIDQQNNTIFQERNQSHTFRAKNPGTYRFIKIRQTCENSGKAYHFRLSQFELFGAYFENKNFIFKDFFKYFGTIRPRKNYFIQVSYTIIYLLSLK